VITEQQREGEVRAPTAGRVTKVHVTHGAVVLPGEAIATIAAKGFILRLQLPERHARFIREGDTVVVGQGGLDGAGGEPRSGTIQQVYPELRQGRVIADVAVEGLGDFFVGERVRVLVGTGTREAVVVPENFLVRRFGLTFAKVKGIGEVVVQIGVPAKGGIEVLSGLRPGDVVITPDTAE